MKRSAREKNSIVIWFLFYFILLFGLILFFSIYIRSSLDLIKEKKVETSNIYKDIVSIETKWLTYDQFLEIANSSESKDKYSVILKNMSENFYSNHLINKNEKSFSDFIKMKTKEIKSTENLKLISNNEKQIINILPTYSQKNITITDKKNLTDFEFINYIESIIDTFNLTSKAQIGIWKIEILEDYVVSTKDWKANDSNIYAIPLHLNITWTKRNIIDFLYFIENVWKIETNNNKIIIKNESDFLSRNWFKKVLSWDKYSNTYNIFEHQIVDINNISFPKYLDDSYIGRKDQWYIDFIKNWQWNELYEIKVNLLFYVKWLPKGEVLDYINNILNNFKALNWYVNKTIWNWNVKWVELIKLKKYKNLLKNLNKKVGLISKDLRSNKDLETIYKSTVKINEIIEPLCDKYEWVCK